MAQTATIQFFERLRMELGDTLFSDFLNIQSAGLSLTIVMDTTTSMTNYIKAAQQRSIEIIDRTQTLTSRPKNYVLVPFNDPEFGPEIRTTDPDVFKKHIMSLYAGYLGPGGDIPEMSMSGILLAAEKSESRSPIFVFTDAAAKDSEKYQSVVATVTEKQQSVYFLGVLPRSLDPLYLHLAASSGGRVMVTTSDEADIFQASTLMEDRTDDEHSVIHTVRTETKKNETIQVDIDSSVTAYVLEVGHETEPPPNVDIMPPNMAGHGRRRRRTSQQFNQELIMNTTRRKVYHVTSPIAGPWKFDVQGSHSGWYFEIRGQTTCDFIWSFEQNAATEADPACTEMRRNPVIGKSHWLYDVFFMLHPSHILFGYSWGQFSIRPRLGCLPAWFISGSLTRLPMHSYRTSVPAVLPFGKILFWYNSCFKILFCTTVNQKMARETSKPSWEYYQRTVSSQLSHCCGSFGCVLANFHHQFWWIHAKTGFNLLRPHSYPYI